MTNSPGRATTPPDTDPTIGPGPARPLLPPLSAARTAVLRALGSEDGAQTVAAVADRLGQHPNTVRDHLDSLLDDGLIERFRAEPAGRGRPAWLYRIAPDLGLLADDIGMGFPHEGREYIDLAVALIDQVADSSPDPGELARQAGRRWGRALADRQRRSDRGHRSDTGDDGADPHPATDPRVMMSELLADLRFDPEPGDGASTLRLTTCPFLAAAKRNPQVVCQVHLGIVQGAWERLGGDPATVDLTPFAEPGACLLQLTERR